jgi:hypothetical protein
MPAAVICAGEVMVGDLDRPASGDKAGSIAFASLDVRRLEVTVDDSLLVRRGERVCDLGGGRQRFGDRNRPLRKPIG